MPIDDAREHHSDANSPFAFKFGELEAILADLNRIPSVNRTAFAARLKNYHRLGFPKDIGVGRGRAIRYGVGEIVQMGLAVELTQLGLTPERAIEVLESDDYAMLMAVLIAARSLIWSPHGFDPAVESEARDPLSMFLYFDPSALSAWSDDVDEDLASATFFYGGSGIVQENIIRWTTGPHTRRLALVNVTAMLWSMARFMADEDERLDFYTAVMTWADRIICRADFDLDAWLVGASHRALVGQKATYNDQRHEWTPLADLIKSELSRFPSQYYSVPEQDAEQPQPDMILHLPGNRSVMVDDKCSPVADAAAVRRRVEELANQPYRAMFTDSTKYVILYLRSDAAFYDAVAEDKRIWEWALEVHKVVIATPRLLPVILAQVDKAWDGADDAGAPEGAA